MSDSVLRLLFQTQAGRLGRALAGQLDASVLDARVTGHLLHTLKAAALSADEALLATQCHAAESALLVADADTLRQALAALLAMLDLSAPVSDTVPAMTLTALQLSLRSGFAASLRMAGQRGVLRLDIAEGAARGLFKVTDIDIATSMVAGAISGLALDLHRGSLPVAAIDAATCALLVQLGLDEHTAEQLGHAPVDFPPPPELPMRWLALPPVAVGETR